MKCVVILFSVLVFFGCNEKKAYKAEITKLPYFNSPDFTPIWSKVDHKIPDFSFVNQNGDTINNATFSNKIYIADFFFTSCPGICPVLTKRMKSIQKTYLEDHELLLLSHTVMPWRDSVSVLKDYARNNGVIDAKWHLVTGDKNALYNIARNGYFADEDFGKTQNESDFIHTENFILIDKEGFIRGVYNGSLAVDIERLKRHIKILKKEG